MADLFTPQTWIDGQQVNAVNGPNRWEAGIDALDTELDAQTDRIDALYQAGGPGGATGQILSGPIAARPSPAIGTLFYDTSLSPPRVIVGTGTSWTEVDGTALSGDGNATSPQNMTAVVQAGGTIGQIVLAWDAVPSATSYKLYETESPSGVSGATALTTTTTTRTPATARNYEYWVTALVSGVESAASNRVQATLPYSGSPPASSDPSTFLNINGKGNGTGGMWNLGIGFDTGHVDIPPTQLQNGYVNNPYYVMNGTATAVQMQVFEGGGKTSANTKYPRCEFREYQTGSTSTKASWSGTSGHHILRYKMKLMHLAPVKPEVVIGQMHDGSDDTLQIRLEASSASGPYTARLSINGSEVDDLKTGIALGQEVAVDIDVNNGALTVKIDGTTQYTGTPSWGSGQYFKVGAYIQQNSTDYANPSSEYGRVEIRDLFVSHS